MNYKGVSIRSILQNSNSTTNSYLYSGWFSEFTNLLNYNDTNAVQNQGNLARQSPISYLVGGTDLGPFYMAPTFGYAGNNGNDGQVGGYPNYNSYNGNSNSTNETVPPYQPNAVGGTNTFRETLTVPTCFTKIRGILVGAGGGGSGAGAYNANDPAQGGWVGGFIYFQMTLPTNASTTIHVYTGNGGQGGNGTGRPGPSGQRQRNGGNGGASYFVITTGDTTKYTVYANGGSGGQSIGGNGRINGTTDYFTAVSATPGSASINKDSGNGPNYGQVNVVSDGFITFGANDPQRVRNTNTVSNLGGGGFGGNNTYNRDFWSTPSGGQGSSNNYGAGGQGGQGHNNNLGAAGTKGILGYARIWYLT